MPQYSQRRQIQLNAYGSHYCRLQLNKDTLSLVVKKVHKTLAEGRFISAKVQAAREAKARYV